MRGGRRTHPHESGTNLDDLYPVAKDAEISLDVNLHLYLPTQKEHYMLRLITVLFQCQIPRCSLLYIYMQFLLPYIIIFTAVRTV
jgi:hypothetical protein